MATWMMRASALGLVLFALGLRAQGAAAPTPQKLEDAIASGDIEAVRKVLDAGADPNGAGEGAPTSPLTFAALKHGDTDIGLAVMRLLLSREADPNLAADLRPLYASILRGSARNADLLIGAGADPDVAGCMRQTLPGSVQGETARALAARKGEPFVSIVAKAHPIARKKNDKKGEISHPLMCAEQ